MVETVEKKENQETVVEAKIPRDYYKVLLVGASGRGKTYSFRNLNPETTGFINIENKPLPFKTKFKHHIRPLNTVQTKAAIKRLAEDPSIESIVIDSFSAYFEHLLSEARNTYKNFDIWNYYNTEIGKIINYIKTIPKEVFITAHYEILGIEGIQEKRVKVKGKEWESLIEKEFTMVLYGDIKLDEKGKPEYIYRLFEPNTSSKCPPEVFETQESIPNDAQFILDKIKEFTQE